MAAHSSPSRAKNRWLERIRAWGIRPSRSKGQNFLLDQDIVDRIVASADVSAESIILEIGPGVGILTESLLDQGAHVTAIELDDSLAPKLSDYFRERPQFRLVHGDATSTDPGELYPSRAPYCVVANLPYGVATVIVRHLFESSHPPETMIVMVQKEVAERMCATTGDHSLLSLAIQYYSEPRLLFTVPETAFYPAPNVTSAVIRMDVRREPLTDAVTRRLLFALGTIAFQQKRKTLLNSLSRGLQLDKTTISNRLTGTGIDASKRPQALSFDEWIRLAKLDWSADVNS